MFPPPALIVIDTCIAGSQEAHDGHEISRARTRDEMTDTSLQRNAAHLEKGQPQ
jgi:hypothetical protein